MFRDCFVRITRADDLDGWTSDYRSIPWLTYRSGFKAMDPYCFTDDAGWGCMLVSYAPSERGGVQTHFPLTPWVMKLIFHFSFAFFQRSAQMMMAHAFLRHRLGRQWRAPWDFDRLKECPAFCDVMMWFADCPGRKCLYSLHNMVQIGMNYDKLPGEWYGPSTSAYVLRDLALVSRPWSLLIEWTSCLLQKGLEFCSLWKCPHGVYDSFPCMRKPYHQAVRDLHHAMGRLVYHGLSLIARPLILTRGHALISCHARCTGSAWVGRCV